MDDLFKDQMTLTDAIVAVQATWDRDVPAPPLVAQGVIENIVTITADANRNAGRSMGYGATLAWGMSIGILAERNRVKRTAHELR